MIKSARRCVICTSKTWQIGLPNFRERTSNSYNTSNRSIYEQQDGAAPGSPVSAVIANLCMEEFEELAIITANCKPKIWKRYEDDAFTILDRNNVDGFLQQLNIQQPAIRFTMEIER